MRPGPSCSSTRPRSVSDTPRTQSSPKSPSPNPPASLATAARISVPPVVGKSDQTEWPSANIAAKKKRRLWGDGKGKFRTKGKHSAATVVGTRWLVEDRCNGTLTKVVKGKVRVRDFRARRTVVVRAGKQYFARSR